MAKRRRRKVNRSAAISDYLAANPEAKPQAIVAALKEQGVVVTPGYVSTIKTKLKSGNRVGVGRGRRAKADQPAVSSNGRSSITVADLIVAKQLADRLGGAARAREALDALVKLS